VIVPDLNFLLAALLSGGFAGSVVLLVLAVRGSDPDPGRPPTRLARWARSLRRPAVAGRIAAGVLVFAGVLVLTRWPVAAVALAVLVVSWPLMFGGQRAEQEQTARLEALVVWTESLRDVMSGHASLEQAIPASVRNAPPLLRPALTQLVGQLRARIPMDRALLQFAATLDDPETGDLVIGALVISTRRRGDQLGEVLTSLATTAREKLEMRRKVTAGRSEIRRGVRVIIGITVGFGVFLAVFGGSYVKPYDTVAGQICLAVVCGIFAAAFMWMRTLSGADTVQPLLPRPGRVADPGDVALVASLTGLSTQASSALTTLTATTSPAATRSPATGWGRR
jgi:tight adherence protein B